MSRPPPPDVDQTIKDAEARGGRVLSGPMDVQTVGRIAVMADPQGAVFAAHTAASEAPGHDGILLIGEASWHELGTSVQPRRSTSAASCSAG